MKAVVFADYGAMPTLTDVPDPACPIDGVALAVGATGLCRSDWHAWTGHERVALPHVPGHELAGTIAELGRNVTRWFAERVAIHAADLNLVRLPDSIDFVTAASLGCRFATAFRALTAHGRLESGHWLAVHGCGGVGLSAVMIASALGARVVAVDVATAALDRARELGAESVVDASEDPAAAVREITQGGAHVSIDAFGSTATAAASVRNLRRRGRHVQVGLLHGAASTPQIPMDQVIARELEIYGSHGMAAHEYPAMLALITSGALRPERLVGRVIGLEDAGAALAAMDRPASRAGMTVIKL